MNIVSSMVIKNDVPAFQTSHGMKVNKIIPEERNIRILTKVANPKVSIIFVARNENEWLRKSLDSLYNTKNNTSYEVIVYDDISDDKCVYDLNTHKVSRPLGDIPVGPARARNFGANLADGEILIFCDSHLKFKDYWIDQLIESLVDGRCDAVNPIISDIAVPTTKGYGWDFDLNTYTYKWTSPTNDFKLVGGIAGGCLAIWKKVFFRCGMFDSGFIKWGMEDSELGLRLALSGYKMGIDPRVDVGHFFKEVNEYGVDWESYNFNFLRMAYVNMNDEDVDFVYKQVPGDDVQKQTLLQSVKVKSKGFKDYATKIRKMDFKEYKEKFGRSM